MKKKVKKVVGSDMKSKIKTKMMSYMNPNKSATVSC